VGPSPTYHQADARLLPHLERERDAGHHRHHVAQMGDLADEVPPLEVAEVDVELAAARGRVALAMYWRRTSSGVAPFTSMEPRLRISGESTSSAAERVRRADRAGLLSQRAEEAADHLRLPVQVDQPLLERPGQAHPIVEFEELFPRQPGPGDGIGHESAGDGHAIPGWRRRDPGWKIHGRGRRVKRASAGTAAASDA